VFLTAKQSDFERTLIDDVKKAILNGRLNSALNSIHNFVDVIFADSNSTAQVFGSRELDWLCLKIGSTNLATLKRPPYDILNRACGQGMVVYLVSCMQESGGHSRLVLDFISAQPDKRHLILSTGVGGKTSKAFLVQLYSIDPNARLISAPQGNLLSRLTWLQSMLLSHSPDYVHLLNHHQDSVAVAAIVPELGVKGSFYHHGDHHFCLGIFLEHLTHVDFHPMGYHFCRENLGIENTYLPLTFHDQQLPVMDDYEYDQSRLTTATVARKNKLEVPYHANYLEVIPRMLKATGGRHIHIGKLSKLALWRMRKVMKELGVPSDRLVYIDQSPSVWRSLQEYRVDIYIASFPYGAGLTLVEALGAGIPVVMHQHVYSRILSGLELAYPEAFSWKYPEELIAYLVDLDPSSLKQERQISRRRYDEFHRPQILRGYFRDPTSFRINVPPLSEKFIPRYEDLQVCITDKKFFYSRFMHDFSYRLWRRFRRFLS
jgi:hypothetical protein